MNEASRRPPHVGSSSMAHQMTIIESPELLDDGSSSPGQWEHPREAPLSPALSQQPEQSGPTATTTAQHHPHQQHMNYLSAPGQVIDEDLRLRIVRTPTESLHEAAREDERRRVGKRKRKGTLRKTLFGQGSKLSRGFSIGSSSIKSPITPSSSDTSAFPLPLRPGTAGSATAGGGVNANSPAGGVATALGMGLYSMNDFAQQIRDNKASTSGTTGDSNSLASPEQGGPSFPPPFVPLTNVNTRTANQEEEAKAELFATPAIAEGGPSTTAGGHPSPSAGGGGSSNNNKGTRGNRTKRKGGFWKSIFNKQNDKKAAELRRRRNVYLNIELPLQELDKHGLPREYSRNKVRTSKYTIWTFVPKNLSEQFRRVANLYFLGLIVLQSECTFFCLSKYDSLLQLNTFFFFHAVFPIFGGTSPYVAMLPLLAILLITAVKDGIEDYRRQQLDDGVNNSAVTRLGDWRNVNVATFQRTFLSRIFGFKSSSSSSASSSRKFSSKKVSKGVRKLREKEGDLNTDFLYEGGSSLMQSSTDLGHNNLMADNTLVEFDSRDSNSTYQAPKDRSKQNASATSVAASRGRSHSSATRSMATSDRTLSKQGVVDYDRQVPGTAKWERTLWKKLEVGDVVLLRENDQVPADIVVLSTSDADGQCFVETKNVSRLFLLIS